jgi:electron transport complex protein RnfA
MSTLAALAVFSGISLNLLLQLGLGIRDLGSKADQSVRISLSQWGILFLSVILLWVFFTYALSPLSLGFMEYFLVFPLTAMAGRGLELLLRRLFPSRTSAKTLFPVMSSYDGMVIAALVLTLRLALSFVQALTLSLGFSLGGLVSTLVLHGVHRRSSIETVPRSLRGIPLLLISMGLLALIFSALAVILLRVLEGAPVNSQ